MNAGSNQITYAAFEAAFIAKHGIPPSEFKREGRGEAWREKMEVLNALAQVPDAPERRGSVRGTYPFNPEGRSVLDQLSYPDPPVALEPTLGDFGAIGEDKIIAFAGFTHPFATRI